MGAGFIPGAIKFLGSVFFGTGLGGASGGYILAVNLARVASLAVIAKLTQPKLDLSDLAAQKTLTFRDTIAPQTFIYGEDLISGPLLFANATGVDDKELIMVVGHAGHEIDSVQRYRLDDKWIELTELSGAEDGIATSGDFLDVLEIELRKGTLTQNVSTLLDTNFITPDLFNAAHTGRGWAYTVWWFAIIEGKEDVWKNQPQNLRALVRGYKVYDPRLDSTNGGTGPHRLATPSTWEWSDNPALCLAHFLMDAKFGMAEESDRIDWPLVIAAANVCDTLVDIPTPPVANQQKRYTCNVTFEATQLRREVRDELVQSMLGRLVFSQGVWKMWAGAVVTSDVTLTEANMAGPLSIQTVKGIDDRYNRLRGKYIDAAEKDYTAASYPEARSTAYVTQDNNEIMVETADFMSTNNFYEAQRKSVFLLRQSRNQRVLSFTGNMSCFRIQTGSVVTLNISELGFASEKFFVTEWKLNPEGTIELTLVEEDDAVWTDLLRAEYATRSKTGVLTFTDTGVSPPTNLTATAFFGGVDLAWTNPAQSTFDHIEIWRSLDNNRANAILIDTSAGTSYRDQKGDAQKIRYYWIRAVDALGRVSAFEPDLTTTTAIAFPYVPQGTLVADPFIRQGASAWDLSQDPTNIIYRTGEGLDGTDAISVQVTASGGTGGFHAFYGAARRGPGTWDVLSPGKISLTINFRISLRTKPLASIWSVAPIAVVRVSDENPALNALTYVSGTASGEHLFTQADSINVWYDESVSLEVTDTGTPPRYLQIGLFFIGNPAEPEFNIDFLDAVLVTPTFKGSNSTGLVPQAGSAGQTTDFLRADGTWANPSVGGGTTVNAGTTSGSTLVWNTTTSEWDENIGVRGQANRLDVINPEGILRLHATTPVAAAGRSDIKMTATGSLAILAIDAAGLNSNVLFAANRFNDTWEDVTFTNETTGIYTFSGGGVYASVFRARGASPGLGLWEEDQALDEKRAVFAHLSKIVSLHTTADTGAFGEYILRATRTGTAVNLVELHGDNVVLMPDTDVEIQAPIFITERAAAAADQIGLGQLWVRNDTPNTLMFTNDAGTDLALDGSIPKPLDFADSEQIRFGTSNDAAIFYDGLANELTIEDIGGSANTLRIGPGMNNFVINPEQNANAVITIGESAATLRGDAQNAILNMYGEFGGVKDLVQLQNTGEYFWINASASQIIMTGLSGQPMELNVDSIKLPEKAAAPADEIAYGQLWIQNTTPNRLVFTNDVGTDLVLDGSVGKPLDFADGEQIRFGTSNDAAISYNGTLNELTIQDLSGSANTLNIGPGMNNIILNPEQNANAVLTIGENSTLRGSGQNAILNMYGEFGSVLDLVQLQNTGEYFWVNASASQIIMTGLSGQPMELNVDSIKLPEKAAAPADEIAYGQIWVKNDIPNTLWFTDDAGTDWQLNAGGGGISGTVANDQIVVGTGASSVDSSADLTFNSTTGILSIGDPGSADAIEIDTDATNAEIRAPSGNNLVLRHGTEIFSSYSANAGRADYYNGTLAAQLTDWNSASSIYSGMRTNDEAGSLTPVGFLTMKNVTISTTSLLPFVSQTVGNFYWHRTVRFTGTAAATWRIDNLTTVPAGTALWVLNRTAFTISFTQGTGVTIRRYLGTGAPSTGTATLAAGGWCTIRVESATAVDIAGVGIS